RSSVAIVMGFRATFTSVTVVGIAFARVSFARAAGRMRIALAAVATLVRMGSVVPSALVRMGGTIPAALTRMRSAVALPLSGIGGVVAGPFTFGWRGLDGYVQRTDSNNRRR